MQPSKITLPEDIMLLSCASSLEHNLTTQRTTYSCHNKYFVNPNKQTKKLFSSFQPHVSLKDTICGFVCESLVVKRAAKAVLDPKNYSFYLQSTLTYWEWCKTHKTLFLGLLHVSSSTEMQFAGRPGNHPVCRKRSFRGEREIKSKPAASSKSLTGCLQAT